jgi:choline-sulfatase
MPEPMPLSLPNIIFILSDDQGCWALGAAGNTEIHTPNLDRLAAEGMRFDNFFCASPVCSPARATLLTGRIPSQHGVHDWLRRGNLARESAAHLGPGYWSEDGPAVEYLAGMHAYTEVLAENGYTCGLSGKWHLGDSLRPQKGFSFWRAVPYGGSDYFNAPVIRDGKVLVEPRYLTDAITDNALDFLNQQLGRPEPFYLSIHHNAPHSPWDTHQHPQELRDLYRDCPFDSVPDLPAHPLQMNSAPRGTGERRRELLTGYYAAISGVDRSLGRILDWLAAHNLRENTLIVFSGDNGMNMGHHGLWGKGNATFPANLYEESVKIPFIMAHSGAIAPGTVSADLLSHYDFMPTLLDYLGLPHPEAEQLPGHSFAALLRGKALAAEAPVFVCDEYGPARMIRTRRWKYTHRYPYGPHELYDLEADPGEECNRVADPAAAEICAQLKARLDEWYARYADPRVDGSREAVYGKGQLERAGVYGQGRLAYASDWWYIDADGQRKSSTTMEE